MNVEAIADAVRAANSTVVLAVHSAAGFSDYAASDRVPDRIAAMVYVDSAPGISALDPDFDGVEKPLVHDHLHRVPVGAGQGLREGAQPCVARRPRRAA